MLSINILNLLRLFPRDPEMELPKPVSDRNYPQFDRTWDRYDPNVVIGFPEIKTCTNHRMEVMMENYDFVACKTTEFNTIPFINCNNSVDREIQDFFQALIIFQWALIR